MDMPSCGHMKVEWAGDAIDIDDDFSAMRCRKEVGSFTVTLVTTEVSTSCMTIVAEAQNLD